MKKTILTLCLTLVIASSSFADDGHTNEPKTFAPGHTNEPKRVLVVEPKDDAENNLITNIITQIYDLFNFAE